MQWALGCGTALVMGLMIAGASGGARGQGAGAPDSQRATADAVKDPCANSALSVALWDEYIASLEPKAEAVANDPLNRLGLEAVPISIGTGQPDVSPGQEIEVVVKWGTRQGSERPADRDGKLAFLYSGPVELASKIKSKEFWTGEHSSRLRLVIGKDAEEGELMIWVRPFDDHHLPAPLRLNVRK